MTYTNFKPLKYHHVHFRNTAKDHLINTSSPSVHCWIQENKKTTLRRVKVSPACQYTREQLHKNRRIINQCLPKHFSSPSGTRGTGRDFLTQTQPISFQWYWKLLLPLIYPVRDFTFGTFWHPQCLVGYSWVLPPTLCRTASSLVWPGALEFHLIPARFRPGRYIHLPVS